MRVSFDQLWCPDWLRERTVGWLGGKKVMKEEEKKEIDGKR